MTTERPDRGARALAERLHEQKLGCTVLCDQYRAGLDGANELSAERTLAALRRQHVFDAEAILANGGAFLPDAAELERLRRIEEAARRIADDHKEGWPSIGAMGQLFRALDPAEPEGSAQG